MPLRVGSVTGLLGLADANRVAKEEFVLQRGPVRNFWKSSWHQVEQIATF